MTRRQLVVTQIVAAVAVSAAIALFVPAMLPAPVAEGPAERLALAAPWLVVMGLPLLVAIGRVGGYRFLSPTAMSGATDPADAELDFRRRLLANMTEQYLLAVPAYAALALLLPADRLQLFAVLAVWYVVARALFAFGYRRAPVLRAFGFAATFWTTIGVVAAVLWLAFAGAAA